MNGKRGSAVKKVGILGAGISGLTVAWKLQKEWGSGLDLTLFEKNGQTGGSIGTLFEKDFLFEKGARAFRGADAKGVLHLIEQLGLNSELISSEPSASFRYLLRQGKLEKLPNSLFSLFTNRLTRRRVFHFMNDLWAAKGFVEDESVTSFFTRRFSKQVVDEFVDPLIKGIYAGNPDQLSMAMCFPTLVEKERNDRSLIWSALKNLRNKKESFPFQGLVTLRGGLITLIQALTTSVQSLLRLNTPIHQLCKTEGGLLLKHARGEDHFDAVISTLPAHALGEIIPAGDLASHLQKIPFITLAVVHLGYKDNVLPIQGFGYLVPEQEQEPLLGTIFDSSVFPEQNYTDEMTRLTVMVKTNKADEALDLALEGVSRHLGIKSLPTYSHAYIAEKSIPQYPVGFLSLREKIMKEAEVMGNFHLLGSSFYGVSVNQCIESSMKINPAVLKLLDRSLQCP